MARLNCYKSLEGCRHDVFERYPSTDYELNWDMNLLIQPPAECRTVEIYRWLKDHCGFNKLMVPVNFEEFKKAQAAGWNSEELLVWWSKGFDTIQMDKTEDDRRFIFGNDSKDFFGWYLDEPQKDDLTSEDIAPLYNHWKENQYGLHFIIGDYRDSWKDFVSVSDIVTYTGTGGMYWYSFFSTDQRGAWSEVYETVGAGGLYWIIYPSDKGEEEDLIEKAKNLEAGTLALFAGIITKYIVKTYYQPGKGWYQKTFPDCDNFKNEVEAFCQIARRKGLLKMKSGSLYLADTYWCRYSDCRECEGHPVTDPRYWQDKPLGGLCPKSEIILPSRTATRLIDDQGLQEEETKMDTDNDSFFFSKSFF